MKSKKAFTLIELVSVLVILAILALIVTPLVLNIIKKAKTAADKRSIDAYGRSIELAIADYLLDNGTFPTSIEELTIEYSGDRVVCETTQLNNDSSVYLAECTVNNREITGYTYGREEIIPKAYSVGDEVTYNNVDYRVIKDSSATEDNVTLLKAEPLTVEEVNEYGVEHINRYTAESQATTYNKNGYGGIAYYTSETCGKLNGTWVYDGCTTEYEQSEVKYIVDAWKDAKAPQATTARLITLNEVTSLGYEWKKTNPTESDKWVKTDAVPTWVYNSNYWYWTIEQWEDGTREVYIIDGDGGIGHNSVIGSWDQGVVRPVIVLSKSVL